MEELSDQISYLDRIRGRSTLHTVHDEHYRLKVSVQASLYLTYKSPRLRLPYLKTSKKKCFTLSGGKPFWN